MKNKEQRLPIDIKFRLVGRPFKLGAPDGSNLLLTTPGSERLDLLTRKAEPGEERATLIYGWLYYMYMHYLCLYICPSSTSTTSHLKSTKFNNQSMCNIISLSMQIKTVLLG